MNQITIGRNATASIVVPSQYTTVSGSHVTIERTGKTYTLTDHSANGTYVNGTKVLNESCHTVMSDTITLGRKYALDMAQVEKLLADVPAEPVEDPVVEIEVEEVPSAHQSAPKAEAKKKEKPAIVDKWSWGGFGLSWVYAAFNGVYWPLAVPALIIFPQLLNAIPIIGTILVILVDIFVWPAALIIRIMLGVRGHRWTWNKFKGSAEEYEDKQRVWDRVGLIFFVVGTILFIVNVIIMPIVLTSLGIFVGITDILDWIEYLINHIDY
ncbi:MAG: FHA domain-containing protein [Paludibacteraceae bacterium]|nr:FHA domain-containing protein [Paludibacteraceae bacterium]